MAKGRKAIPTQFKKLVGNPGKRRLNEREPQFAQGVPHCPDWLDDAAKAMWNRVCGEIAASGVLTRADEGVLVGYCVAYSQLVEVSAVIKQDGLKMSSSQGERAHPLLSVKNQALSQLRAFGTELGLSPAARSRLQTPTKHDDEFDEWQRDTA